MKKLILVLAVFFAVSTVMVAQKVSVATKNEVQKTTYACPMHPKEVSDKKGKCSKCGMDLVATKEKTNKVKKSQYECTMDGATADKPGKCPKCGMAMTEKKVVKK